MKSAVTVFGLSLSDELQPMEIGRGFVDLDGPGGLKME